MSLSPLQQFQAEAEKSLKKNKDRIHRPAFVAELCSMLQRNLGAVASSGCTALGHVLAFVVAGADSDGHPGGGNIRVACDRAKNSHLRFHETFSDAYRTYAKRSRIIETFPSPPIMGIDLTLSIFPDSGALSAFACLQTEARIKLLGKEAFFDRQWEIVARAVASLDARLRDAGSAPALNAPPLSSAAERMEPRHAAIFLKAMKAASAATQRACAREEASERVFQAISANLEALVASESVCFVNFQARNHGDGTIGVYSIGGVAKLPGDEPNMFASSGDFSRTISIFPQNRRLPVLSRSAQDLRLRLVDVDKIIDREWRRLAKAIAVADAELCHYNRWPRRGALTSAVESSEIEASLHPVAPSTPRPRRSL